MIVLVYEFRFCQRRTRGGREVNRAIVPVNETWRARFISKKTWSKRMYLWRPSAGIYEVAASRTDDLKTLSNERYDDGPRNPLPSVR